MIIQDNGFYLTFCTFSFKFKESSLSYAKCGITTPLIKEWHDFARDVLMLNYLVLTSYHWDARKKHLALVNGKIT